MGHSKGVRGDVWPLQTERKEENEKGMRARRDGHRWVTQKE